MLCGRWGWIVDLRFWWVLMGDRRPSATIVDYGLGNLFSVHNACTAVGFQTIVSSDPGSIVSADLVILPGVGAFGDAMASLKRLGLTEAIQGRAEAGGAILGICLGMQVLMSEGTELGRWTGLDIVKGSVLRLNTTAKIPQVGWNRILRPPKGKGQPWAESPLAGIEQGEYMYFVHAYHAQPEDPDIFLAQTLYGGETYCSGFRYKNVFGFQFHPERSGPAGLILYRNLARWVGSGCRDWTVSSLN